MAAHAKRIKWMRTIVCGAFDLKDEVDFEVSFVYHIESYQAR